MAEPSQAASSFLHRLLARIGNPLEWSEVDKCIGATTIILFFLLYQDVLVGTALPHLQIAPYINREGLVMARNVNRALMGAWILVLLAGLRLRRRDPGNLPLTVATTQLYAAQTVWGAYFTGFYTFPWGTLLVLTGAVLGFLLFQPRVVIWACVTGALLMVGSTLAEYAGLIPSAPFFRQAPPPYNGQGFGGDLVLWAPFLLVCEGVLVALYAYTLWRWRDREEKLARAYRELNETKDALVRAESLASVGSLVTGAAHELRNPLGASGALLQSLKDDIAACAATEAEKRDAFESIDRALSGQRRAAAIVERLYGLTEDLAEVDARCPLGVLLGELQARYPPLTISRAEGFDPEVPVSRRVLESILANLIDNALAATGAETAPPLLRVRTTPAEIELAVADSGRGIPRELRAEVFKPFVTGEKAGAGHGVGLGLYIVHELVARLGGTLSLESQERVGTTITIALPRRSG